MAQDILGYCPVCKEKLIATKLSCKNCGLELINDFSLSKFNYLKNDELEFIEIYLKCHGNMKELQKQLKLSYPSAKKKFNSILKGLGYIHDNNVYPYENAIITELPIYKDDSSVIKCLKSKLNRHFGKAVIPLRRGGEFCIYYEAFGNGITATNLPANHTMTWNSFDCAVEILRKNGGRAKKGQAMKARLGEPDLPLDSVEGYVAYNAYGVKKGEFALRTISPLSSILEWLGICKNGYGYLELK